VRSIPKDVEMAIAAGVAGTGVILLGNEQYRTIFGWTLDEALENALAAGKQARAAGLATTLLIADSPRLSESDLRLIVESASGGDFGALALMDTFGTLKPEGTRRFIGAVREMTHLPIEFHAHNDFGLATANSLAAITAGAEVVHTSVIGLGERVGNAALEEVAVAATVLEGISTRLNLERITQVADLVMRESRVTLAPHKPIVGGRITEIESGTVAAEYARWSTIDGARLEWLFPYLPSLVGGRPVRLVLGKGSGLANIEAALARLDIQIAADEKAALLDVVKSEGSRLGRTLTDEQFTSLADQAVKRRVNA
jgi:isopropylmalate/homocitrate/citramalate synthase